MRTARRQAKFKVQPFNIRNGNKAPYFIIEPESKAKKDEIEVLANETFKVKSALAKYNNWSLSIEKV